LVKQIWLTIAAIELVMINNILIRGIIKLWEVVFTIHF